MRRKDKVRYKKLGGGSFRLITGKIVKQNEIFEAYPHEIPNAFKDLLVVMDEKVVQIPEVSHAADTDVDEVEVGTESGKAIADTEDTVTESKPDFYMKEAGRGWWHVYDSEDTCISSNKLRKNAAEELLAELLA